MPTFHLPVIWPGESALCIAGRRCSRARTGNGSYANVRAQINRRRSFSAFPPHFPQSPFLAQQRLIPGADHNNWLTEQYLLRLNQFIDNLQHAGD